MAIIVADVRLVPPVFLGRGRRPVDGFTGQPNQSPKPKAPNRMPDIFKDQSSKIKDLIQNPHRIRLPYFGASENTRCRNCHNWHKSLEKSSIDLTYEVCANGNRM